MDKNHIEKIRTELNDYRERTGVSFKRISNSLAGLYGASTISLFASGKYTGDETALAVNLQKFLDEEKQSISSHPKQLQVVQIQTLREIIKVGKYAKDQKKLCVITGEPGTGKSIAVKAFRNKYTGIILIEAVPTIGPKELMKLLHAELRLSETGSIHSMFKEVEKRLSDSNTIVVVDEAENLPKRCLELVRRLWDLASIGVLLVGTNQLIRNLRGRRGEFAQLYSRVGLAHEVGVLNEKDAQEIISANLPGVNSLWRVIFSHSKKNARHLGNLLDAIRIVAGDTGRVTEDLIEEAATTLITN
jgi:hypothetical protein